MIILVNYHNQQPITFIRIPKNQSQNKIIYSTNHKLSPEFLRMASCLEQINTLICIDGNNTHSVFSSMLRRLMVWMLVKITVQVICVFVPVYAGSFVVTCVL